MILSAFPIAPLGRAIVLGAVVFLGLLSPAPAAEPATFDVGDFTFTRPADWKWIPVNSPMRKAQLQVPGSSAETGADVTFFYFTGPGGDPVANTQRWLAQFQSKQGAEKTEKKEFSGTTVTIVTTQGTFASGMPGQATTPMADYALLGAIMEGKEGSVFVKMTGPAALVKDARGKFDEFIATAAKSRK